MAVHPQEVSPNGAAVSTVGQPAAIYTRVSTQEQSDHGYSLGAQEQDCRKLAEELHLQIVNVFRDADSGASWDLPGLNALLDAAKRREFATVLVYDPDRLARRMAKQLVIEEELTRSSIAIKYVTLRLGDTAEDNLLKNVRSSIAEYERSKIALRTSRGRRAKAERGIVVGSGVPPYGYLYTRDVSGRVNGMTPDPNTAPIVQRIFREVVTTPVNRVCDRLNADGIPTYLGGEKWANATILEMVKNPVYIGTAAYGRRDVSNGWRKPEQWLLCAVPPIVTVEQKTAAREGLASRRGRGDLRFDGDDPYLLRGLLTCGHCGGQLAISPVRSPQGRIYRYYNCLRHQPARRERSKGTELCRMPPIAAVPLEEHAWDRIASTLLNPGVLERGLAEMRDQRNGVDARRRDRLATLEKEIERLRRRIQRIHSERLEADPGSESDRALKALAQEAEGTVARLLADKADLQTTPSPGLEDAEIAALQHFAAEMGAGIEHATAADKRRVFELFRLRATLREDENGQRFGRDHRFGIDWETAIEIADNSGNHKKTRVRYFSPELDEWHLSHGLAASEAS